MEETNNSEKLRFVLKLGMTQEQKKKEVEAWYPSFWIVRTLRQGDAFGEIALQRTGNRMRTATIVCQDETLVGTLTYEDYQLILGKLFIIIEMRNNALKKLSYLKGRIRTRLNS